MSTVGATENAQTLADAVARNAAAVLSLPSAGMIHNHKTRFVGESDAGIWIEIPNDALLLLEALERAGDPLAVSFHSNHRRLSFATTVVKIDSEFKVNDTVTIRAVLVAPATEVKGVQRRNAYRVRVPQDSDLHIKVWQITDHAVVTDRPPASAEIKLEVRDVSTGGLGVVLGEAAAKRHQVVPDQRVRVELNYNDIELVLDGRLRNIDRKNGPPITGIVFKKLEGDVEGRQALASITRIVGELSRDEVRRMRRSSSAAA